MNTGVNIAIFYVSVAVFVAGIIRSARAAVERNVRDRLGLTIALAGVVGLAVAVIAFATGPRTALPF